MRTETVEIYSDASNAAILRHPGRRVPGVLVQGDTLHLMLRQVEDVCSGAESLSADAYDELTDLRDKLRSLLDHYETVLGAHQIPLPFPTAAGT